jgi:ribonuclease P protein component
MLVVHLGVTPGDAGVARAGLVVGKAVGNAVQRNRVKRRLRHLLRERVDRLPADAALVVRALPPSGKATSGELGAALDTALTRLQRTGARR